MAKRTWLPLAALALLGVLAAYALRTFRTPGEDVGASPSVVQILDDRRSPQVVRGEGNLTVVMFTDYQCPSCRLADPALRAAIARDGNIRLIYRDWPIFGERSERAAKVALAAHRQGIYPALHQRLMTSASLDEAALRAAVEHAGGNWERLEADLLAHGTEISDQLADNGSDAFALGLEGTPGYLIGPLLVEGALTEREFLRAFGQARSRG
jgi:protein-disulfide isomerase